MEKSARGGRGSWFARGVRAVTVMITAVFLGIVPVVLTPAHACACGALLLGEGQSAWVDTEQAILSWDGQTEEIVLSMDIDSPADRMALLIPTPAPATVSIAAAGAFAELNRFTEPVEVIDKVWWPGDSADPGVGGSAAGSTGAVAKPLAPNADAAGGDRAGDDGAGDDGAGDDGVGDGVVAADGATAGETSPDRIEIEGFRADVMAAADADRLAKWLEANEFVMRDKIAAALTPYIQQEWYFVAIALDATKFSGVLESLTISFAAKQLIYPMRLSAAGIGPLSVRTHVFAEHRMERADPMRGQILWAGPVTPTDFANDTLVRLADDFPFLTVWHQDFDYPEQIVSDMVFAAAATDAAVQQTVIVPQTRTFLGVPTIGVLIGGGVVAAGAAGWWVRRTWATRRHDGQPDDE